LSFADLADFKIGFIMNKKREEVLYFFKKYLELKKFNDFFLGFLFSYKKIKKESYCMDFLLF